MYSHRVQRRGRLWWSLAVQSENSRSVLAGWLPLCDATSSLAGTDRCVTSLIRTQLHCHIKGFPFFLYQEWDHNPWDISAPTPHPPQHPAPHQKKKKKKAPSHLCFSVGTRRRLRRSFGSFLYLCCWGSQAVLNYDNDVEDAERADEASYYPPPTPPSLLSDTSEGQGGTFFSFCQVSMPQIRRADHLLVGAENTSEERTTCSPPDRPLSHYTHTQIMHSLLC